MIYDYKKYLKLIKEGIIFTHNIEKYQNNLDIQLSSIGVKHKINIISKFIYDLDILNSKELSNDVLKYAININQNLLGYYPSYIWIVNEIGKNGFVFDERYLSNEFLNITIRFESKYEDGLYKNDLEIPEYAYHLSPKNKRDKILKNGLCPHSYNRKTKHPDRLYLFYEIDDYEDLLKNLIFNDRMIGIDREYDLYKIRMNDKMIIHSDPNYDRGFYTYDNISPADIKLIKIK